MEIKHCLFVIITLLLTSCGCNDDGFESFELNEYERSVIPFTSDTIREFFNENSQISIASISAKTKESFDLNASDDGSCFTSLVERDMNKYKFDFSEKNFYIIIEKRKRNYTNFFIFTDEQEYYYIQNIETEDIQNQLTNTIIKGFEYNEIFILSSNNPQTEFDTIIYSANNGIEFMKYRNGNYLKLDL